MGFNFNFNVDHVRQLVPHAVGGPEWWYQEMFEALPKYDINTIPRVAYFIAQCAHESGGFVALEENLNYSAANLTKIWPQRYPSGIAERYAGKPEKIANKSYGGRMGNGSEASGDGWRFRGRGLIQLTGRSNYTNCSRDLFGDDTLLETPDILFDPYYAIHSACWFWDKMCLNQYADSGDIVTMTKKINGGTLGLDDRQKRAEHAIEVLSGH